mgnify:CR=1 FL=1
MLGNRRRGGGAYRALVPKEVECVGDFPQAPSFSRLLRRCTGADAQPVLSFGRHVQWGPGSVPRNHERCSRRYRQTKVDQLDLVNLKDLEWLDAWLEEEARLEEEEAELEKSDLIKVKKEAI